MSKLSRLLPKAINNLAKPRRDQMSVLSQTTWQLYRTGDKIMKTSTLSASKNAFLFISFFRLVCPRRRQNYVSRPRYESSMNQHANGIGLMHKVDKKAPNRTVTDTIGFHIRPQTPNGKGTPTTKIKTARVKSQGDNSFPTDGHKAILNKFNSKSKTSRKLTNIDN